MNSEIVEKVKWAEGRKKSELPKYTWWSGSKESARLGGFTIKMIPKYIESEVDGSIRLTAHTSQGESYWKNFDVPLDKVDELCDALQKVKKFAESRKYPKKNHPSK